MPSNKIEWHFIPIFSFFSELIPFFARYLIFYGNSKLLAYTSLSLVSLIALQLIPTPTMNMIVAGAIGLFAAGGLFQLALSILLELFLGDKGKKTSMMSLVAATQTLVVPMVTGFLVGVNVALIITFNIVLTAISVIISAIVRYRYNKLTTPITAEDTVELFEATS